MNIKKNKLKFATFGIFFILIISLSILFLRIQYSDEKEKNTWTENTTPPMEINMPSPTPPPQNHVVIPINAPIKKDASTETPRGISTGTSFEIPQTNFTGPTILAANTMPTAPNYGSSIPTQQNPAAIPIYTPMKKDANTETSRGISTGTSFEIPQTNFTNQPILTPTAMPRPPIYGFGIPTQQNPVFTAAHPFNTVNNTSVCPNTPIPLENYSYNKLMDNIKNVAANLLLKINDTKNITDNISSMGIVFGIPEQLYSKKNFEYIISYIQNSINRTVEDYNVFVNKYLMNPTMLQYVYTVNFFDMNIIQEHGIYKFIFQNTNDNLQIEYTLIVDGLLEAINRHRVLDELANRLRNNNVNGTVFENEQQAINKEVKRLLLNILKEQFKEDKQKLAAVIFSSVQKLEEINLKHQNLNLVNNNNQANANTPNLREYMVNLSAKNRLLAEFIKFAEEIQQQENLVLAIFADIEKEMPIHIRSIYEQEVYHIKSSFRRTHVLYMDAHRYLNGLDTNLDSRTWTDTFWSLLRYETDKIVLLDNNLSAANRQLRDSIVALRAANMDLDILLHRITERSS